VSPSETSFRINFSYPEGTGSTFFRNVVTNIPYYKTEKLRRALFKLKSFCNIQDIMTDNVTFRVPTCC
jgi:hypothetical protein